MCEEESERFQVPINTDHRLTAEQLFALDEKKRRQATKKGEIRGMKNESKRVKTKVE